jgi:hypothetical protein
MEEETISVEPSAENGNLPVDAPSEQQEETVIPTEEIKGTVQPIEPTLYDLPDGRKVDGETLAKEWKDNFLPEFTRKSQALAEIEKAKNINNKEVIEDPYEKPDYIPQSYAEIIKEAEKRALETLENREKKAIEQQQAVETEVSNQLSELKKLDANLNEDVLFLHANEYREKYGVSFPNLKTAYKHMKDVEGLTKTVQQTTVKNMQKKADPVSTTGGKANGVALNPNQFSNAREYLKALGGTQ